MLTLSRYCSIRSSTIHSSVQRRNYTEQQKTFTIDSLSKTLLLHIKNNLYPNAYTELEWEDVHAQTRDIFCKARNYTSYGDDKVLAVKESLQKSICRSTHGVMERTFGSKKGIMHCEDYFAEMNIEGSFQSFMHVKLSECSDINRNFTGKNFYFTANEGVNPAEAVESFLEGPSAADCGTTVEAIFAKAVIDELGHDKFNAYIAQTKKPMQIRPKVCEDEESSLWPLMEYVNPWLTEPTDPTKLEIGDHIVVCGVPWYSVKHPLGMLRLSHAIVLDHNEKNESLLGGLDTSRLKTISEIMQDLVTAYNAKQTATDEKLFNKMIEDPHTWCEIAKAELANSPELVSLALDLEAIYKTYSVEEIKQLQGCTSINLSACRLSPLVIALLKTLNCTDDLVSAAATAKAYTLAWNIHAVNDTPTNNE